MSACGGGGEATRQSGGAAGVAAASIALAAVRRYRRQVLTELATLLAARVVHGAVKLDTVLLSCDRATSTLADYGSALTSAAAVAKVEEAMAGKGTA